MSGLPFMALFAATIVLMVAAIARFKIHPFLAILSAALALAFASGAPVREIPAMLGEGFAKTFTSVGLVIIFGIIIGSILGKTGAALRIADAVLSLVGRKRPVQAVEIIGF